jgi:hypothetical protein
VAEGEEGRVLEPDNVVYDDEDGEPQWRLPEDWAEGADPDAAEDEALPGDNEPFVAGEGVEEALRVVESGGQLPEQEVNLHAIQPPRQA